MTASAQPIAVSKIPREGKEESQFQIILRRFMRHKLAVAGVHNVRNALAALAAAVTCNVPTETALAALKAAGR